VQHEPAPVSGFFDRIRLHLVVSPVASVTPSSVWIMELANVDWEPPNDWPAELEDAVSGPGAQGVPVTFDLSTDDSVLLDIVVRTSKGLARVIGDRHHVASMLEGWAQPGRDAGPSDQEVASGEAEAAVLFALESHFGLGREEVESVAVEYEPGAERFVHVRAGAAQYLGTVTRHGRVQVSQVVERTDR